MHRRATARDIGVRPGLVLLAFAVLAVLGGALVGTASATSQDVAALQAEPSPSLTTGLPERAVQPTQTTQPNLTPNQPSQSSAQTRVYLQVQPTEPAKAIIAAGERQGYTATVRGHVGPDQWSIDVTRWTSFSMDPDGKCSKARGKVSCAATNSGPHTVIGILPPTPSPKCHSNSAGRRSCWWCQGD